MLEKHLGYSIEDSLWVRLEEAGIVCGAFMLLWSKGTAKSKGTESASTEWDWWINRLEIWSRN